MSKVAFPITIVDCIDIGLDLEKIQNKLQSYYDEYEYDLYLLHKNKINYISKFTKLIMMKFIKILILIFHKVASYLRY